MMHDPEKWTPVSRLREALARPNRVAGCFGGRRQVGKRSCTDKAPRRIAEAVAPHLHATETPVAPISRPLGRAWHVVHTGVNCEMRARLGIEALGFPVYLPCETRTVRHARRSAVVKRPLFARYLFASFDAEREPWGAINATPGVAYVLYRDPNVPACIPDAVIERLRRAEAAGEFDLTTSGVSFAPGAAVRVEEGPFADMTGEVRRADSKHRVAVLLNFIHRTITVEVPASMLRAVASPDRPSS